MIDRIPPAPLEDYYQRCAKNHSDINEHLPLLRELASECEHVTEFGLRWANGSTVAFLAAQPDEFISYDVDPLTMTSGVVRSLIANAGRTKFQPRCGDTLKINIEPTDLLFIDTYHTARHLLSELERHADPAKNLVKKYLVFHDTATFGMTGEDGSTPGLRTAIRQFQRLFAFPLWNMVHAKRGVMDFKNCNGLVVLTSERWNEELARR
jgi:cephalosporin hydroxylase